MGSLCKAFVLTFGPDASSYLDTDYMLIKGG